MKIRIKMKALFILFVILFMTSCGKSDNEINPLILGEWRLFEIYGVKEDNTLGWLSIPESPTQTINFSLDGKYSLALDGSINCNGNFIFENKTSIKFSPGDCMPLIESVETIYTLT